MEAKKRKKLWRETCVLISVKACVLNAQRYNGKIHIRGNKNFCIFWKKFIIYRCADNIACAGGSVLFKAGNQMLYGKISCWLIFFGKNRWEIKQNRHGGVYDPGNKNINWRVRLTENVWLNMLKKAKKDR